MRVRREEAGFQVPANLWVPVMLLMGLSASITLNIYLHLSCGAKAAALGAALATVRTLKGEGGVGGGRYDRLYTQREMQQMLKREKEGLPQIARDFNDEGERAAGGGVVGAGDAAVGGATEATPPPASPGVTGEAAARPQEPPPASASPPSIPGGSRPLVRKQPPAELPPGQWRNTTGAGQGQKILLDLGANCGNSYKKLVNQNRWQRKRAWDKAYLFEWNPRIIRLYLNKLAKEDPRVVLIPNPAWGEDKNMTFYMDNRDTHMSDEDYLKRYPCTTKVNTFNTPEDSGTMLKGYGRAGQPVEVFAVGFPKWFMEQDDVSQEDLIYLKIDIEGAECSVIDAWMDAGLTCLVQEYYVEWHDVFTPEVKECATRTRNRLIETAAKCQHHVGVFTW